MPASRSQIPSRGRILAVDPGTRRIGVAVSDPDRVLAQPLTTLTARGRRKDVLALLELASEHDVVALVVGLPWNMDGSEGPAFEASRRLLQALRESTDLPVRGWDERLTSTQAERMLIASGVRRDRRRQHGAVDRVAAALILESYLAALASGAAETDDQP